MVGKKAHILYVDDERQNLVSFKASFRHHFKVSIALGGREALEILEEHPNISLIISDQRMPVMSGVEFLEKVQERHPKPIRMVMTGYSDIEAVIQSINKGKIYYYITKPWNLDELKMVIDKALNTFRLQEENHSLQAEKALLMLRAAEQERENMRSQFEALRNQVNPHFLFNSLNALSSLVHEDADLAESFILKLTKIYRYVLDLKDQSLISLEEELLFIDNYLFLQQIRFGNNLRLYRQIAKDALKKKVPPLSLQLLIENAIKHNEISSENPLTIELKLDGTEVLLVSNNLQKRLRKAESTGLGLENLRKRYQMLSDKSPEFMELGNQYLARIPLL
ncbi:MAG: histidine kinase [Bacteroidota bacterium]